MARTNASFRLSNVASMILRNQSKLLGLSKTAVIEMTLRTISRKEGNPKCTHDLLVFFYWPEPFFECVDCGCLVKAYGETYVVGLSAFRREALDESEIEKQKLEILPDDVPLGDYASATAPPPEFGLCPECGSDTKRSDTPTMHRSTPKLMERPKMPDKIESYVWVTTKSFSPPLNVELEWRWPALEDPNGHWPIPPYPFKSKIGVFADIVPNLTPWEYGTSEWRLTDAGRVQMQTQVDSGTRRFMMEF